MDGGLRDRLQEHGERLASIQTDIALLRKELLGNGQKGRLTLVEDDVKALNHLKGYVYGAWGAIATIGGIAAYFFLK